MAQTFEQLPAGVVPEPVEPQRESLSEPDDVSLLEQSSGSSAYQVDCARFQINTPSAARSQDSFEFDLGAPSEADFDPDPLQLETTGLTPHPSEASSTGQRPKYEIGALEDRIRSRNDIAAGLTKGGMVELADKLRGCHSVPTYAKCDNCGSVKRFLNRCDLVLCPICQPKQSRRRREGIEWWAREIQQPKHVVLTVRNADAISRTYLNWLKQKLTALRRRKFARNWKGGFYSLEITNEGRGWHAHLHLLIDARFVDARVLAQQWASLVNQDYAIVKVKDARTSDYLKELTKYIGKPAQIAKWSPSDLCDFARALDGVRTFGVFGSLYGKRTEFAEWIKSVRDHKPRCDCGCQTARYLSWNELCALDCNGAPQPSPRPPPDLQSQFALGIIQSPVNASLVG